MADKTAFDYVNEIWSIANYVRDVIRPADYNKLILPFAVLRRFECALEPTRAAVSRQAAKGVWDDDDPKYCALSGHCFYNVTSFTLSNLGATKTCDALMAYINGFSANAREVLQRFEMRQTCEKLDEKGMLYEVCTRFSGFDLGPETVSDRMMTDIYEHLIQRYGEEISQDAEDFMTPKDVARLATALLFANEDTLLNADNGDIRTLYDGSCGTCGFICDALDQLDEWHDKGHFSSPTKIVPYGQELEDATWAMGKAALMLRNIAGGSGDVLDQMTDLSAGIMLGDTLDDDRFEGRTFNYQLTNPPYGKEWKKEKDVVLEEMGRGFEGRFGAGKPDIDDGSMLFMQNVAAKMAPPEEGGGKAAIVLSGSPLFNGDAGSGPSGIRRWLFSEDLVDCIVKLPTEIFYRTGIATYIWVLNNHKPENRKGYVQLIDASEEKTALRKSQGNKRYEVGEDQAAWIVRTYVDGHILAFDCLCRVTDNACQFSCNGDCSIIKCFSGDIDCNHSCGMQAIIRSIGRRFFRRCINILVNDIFQINDAFCISCNQLRVACYGIGIQFSDVVIGDIVQFLTLCIHQNPVTFFRIEAVIYRILTIQTFQSNGIHI